MSEKALEAARDALAAAIYDSPELSLAEIENTINSLPPETFERWAQATIERHYDSLLGDLPEEAVNAVSESAYGYSPPVFGHRDHIEKQLSVFVRSLRGGLGGGA